MVRRIGALLVTLLGLGLASAAATAARARAPQASSQRAAVAPRPKAQASLTPAAPELRPETVFSRLRPVRISSPNAHDSLLARLYDERGQIDESSARKLDALLADCRDPEHVQEIAVDRRTLQLVYRAAYHFRAEQVEVVSAYRAPGRRREGLHGTGRAIDFRLKGVKAAALASYLRTLPRVGVGVYTHKKTQYVHLDVREHSYHWLDASPPGRTWREQRLSDPSIIRRDTHYTPESDWPEQARPPQGTISRSSTAPGSAEGNDHG
jgi:uncharacterized protein YcbK (DUF882 family)